MNTVYRKKNFKIYSMGDEFIVHNMKKEFQDGHTHLNNFNTCKYIIDLSIHKSLPHHLNRYFLVSLKRLSTDPSYTRKIDDLLEAKKENHLKYYNKPKHMKRK